MKLHIRSVLLLSLFVIAGCSSKNQKNSTNNQSVPEAFATENEEFQFQPLLDSYIPQKKSYNFYLTYNTKLPIPGGTLLPLA